MKPLVYLLLILALLPSCSNNGVNENEATNITESSVSDSLKEKFIPYFSGVWTLSDYIDDLAKTKSPLKSSDKLNQIVLMIFSEKPQGNKIPVASSCSPADVCTGRNLSKSTALKNSGAHFSIIIPLYS
jgi:hypothetical protein